MPRAKTEALGTQNRSVYCAGINVFMRPVQNLQLGGRQSKAQYQYILDPHSVTAQFAYVRSHHRYPDFLAGQPVAFVDQQGNPLANTNSSDTTNVMRAKLTYVYRAMYGGSLGFFGKFKSPSGPKFQRSSWDPSELHRRLRDEPRCR